MVEESLGGVRGTPAPPSVRTGKQKAPWVAGLSRFEKPDGMKVTWQLLNTLLPYVALLGLMYGTIAWHLSYGITLLLAVPAAALLVRLFVLFHDCVHGSYLSSPIARQIVGNILGVLVFTSFSDWRRSHGIHHSTSGNLDRRGIGDIWTMTADEYEGSSPLRRLRYRLFRNPLVMFGIGPFFTFVIAHRLPTRGANRKQTLNVLLVDLAIAAIVIAACVTIGLKAYLMIQLPVLLVGGVGGVWLFYVQHQFDPSYWARSEAWEPTTAAMRGSSYYKLPRVLQWISGNIGLHHIHHLRPRIPNYNLQRCLNETPELQLPDPLRFWPSLKSVRLKLWDERRNLLLTFRQFKQQLRERPSIA